MNHAIKESSGGDEMERRSSPLVQTLRSNPLKTQFPLDFSMSQLCKTSKSSLEGSIKVNSFYY
jgi:hypothetical protein